MTTPTQSLFLDYLTRIQNLEQRISELEESEKMLQDIIKKQKNEVYIAKKQQLLTEMMFFRVKMLVDSNFQQMTRMKQHPFTPGPELPLNKGDDYEELE